MSNLSQTDPQTADFLNEELLRQQESLELIPSENIVSRAVLEALGSIATNKYSEGYPGKRYYGGCHVIDNIEQLAIDRARALFGAEHVNVQPLSGAPANIAAYEALLQHGDTVLGMDLSHGGHLTHGHPVTQSAKIYRFVRYKTNTEGLLDLDNLRAMALEHRPKLILVGYSAYSREIDFARVKEIADEVGALCMADIAHIAGLVAAGEMNNPVPYFDIVTSTTHKSLRGPRGGLILCKEQYAKAVDKAVFPGLQGGPHEHVIAAKAVCFAEAQTNEFKEYARQIKKNAKVFEKVFSDNGYRILFGGTDNHLLLIDVTPQGITGKEAERVLDEVGITVNKNMIPDDPRSPMDPSGIRIGTPSLTTRGMKESETEMIARAMHRVLSDPSNDALQTTIREEIRALCLRFPIYPDLSY